MNKFLKHITLIGFLVLAFAAKAQQRPLFTQYWFNQYLINPAYTGIYDHYVASTNYRYQWAGLVDAPRTYSLSVHGPNNANNYGIGGSLYNDVTGPTSKTGAYASYAYHFKINSSQKIALGLSGGIMQYRVDGTKVTVFDQGDLVLSNNRLTTLVPDFGIGAYWYKKDKYYAGISIPQFIQSELDFTDNNVQTISKLTNHFFINGGYKFTLNSNFSIEPSALIKYSYPVVPQFDVGVRGFFKDIVWLGAMFRTQDAFSVVLGLNTPDKRFSFGYAYDFTTTNIANYSNGTHEIMLNVRFTKKRGYSAKGKEVYSDFERMQKKFEAIELENYQKEQEKNRVKDSLDKAKKDFDQKGIQEQIKELEQKDKDLRNQIRTLREEAKAQGMETPNDPAFAKRNDYLNLLEEIKKNYRKLDELKTKLN